MIYGMRCVVELPIKARGKWFKVCFVQVSSSINLSHSSQVSAVLYDPLCCPDKVRGEVECFIRQQDHNPSAIRRVKHNLPALNSLKFVSWVLLGSINLSRSSQVSAMLMTRHVGMLYDYVIYGMGGSFDTSTQ